MLFFADGVFADHPGGAQLVADRLAEGLGKRGYACRFLVARRNADAPSDEQAKHGVRISRYGGVGGKCAIVNDGRKACRSLIREQLPNVVHTHFAYSALGPLSAVDRSIPQVRSFYGPWDEEGWIEDSDLRADSGARGIERLLLATKHRLKRSIRHQIEAHNLRRSARVIVLSEHSRRELNAFRYPSDQIVKITGGADIDRFRPSADKNVIRSRLGLPANANIILSIRRLAPRMGLDNLIQAMLQVIGRVPNSLLLIGGKGPDAEKLQRRITQLRLNEHVRLLGFIPDEQIASYYQAADLFVLPSLALEGFGLVTVEALACGTPVLGTPVGATPEILGDLDPRLILRGSTPQDLASGIISFFAGDWAREFTADRLAQFVRDRYTWDRHVSGVEAVYREVLAEAERHPDS